MFHKEGYKIILITTIAIGIAFIFIDKFVVDEILNRTISILILVLYLFILQQFRNSKRKVNTNPEAILSPIDGKLKSIESGKETKLTFIVSPFNFHLIRAPFNGKITQVNTDPISIEISDESKRSNCVISIEPGNFSQDSIIYSKKNSSLEQGEEIGFIKFDARVTIIVPKNSKLEVKINDRVKAGEHIIATI